MYLLNFYAFLQALQLSVKEKREYLTRDENEISLYTITTCSNNQVMRIKKEITKEEMSWYLDNFSLLVPQMYMYGEKLGEYAFNIRA